MNTLKIKAAILHTNKGRDGLSDLQGAQLGPPSDTSGVEKVRILCTLRDKKRVIAFHATLDQVSTFSIEHKQVRFPFLSNQPLYVLSLLHFRLSDSDLLDCLIACFLSRRDRFSWLPKAGHKHTTMPKREKLHFPKSERIVPRESTFPSLSVSAVLSVFQFVHISHSAKLQVSDHR